LRCADHPTGNGARSRGRSMPSGCRPSRIASTRSGASSVSRSRVSRYPPPLDLPSRGHLADRGVAPLAQQLSVPGGSGQRRLSTWDKASYLSCRIGITTYPAPAAADKLAGKIAFAQDRGSAGRAIRFGWERRERCRQP
jgi:hypothetical protein